MNTQQITQKLMNDLYAELEDTLLCLMSAGIPADMICLSEPEIKSKEYSYYLVCEISFKY